MFAFKYNTKYTNIETGKVSETAACVIQALERLRLRDYREAYRQGHHSTIPCTGNLSNTTAQYSVQETSATHHSTIPCTGDLSNTPHHNTLYRKPQQHHSTIPCTGDLSNTPQHNTLYRDLSNATAQYPVQETSATPQHNIL